MRSLNDYQNPFDAVVDFERMLADYTNAPYAIVTDCCTHAIEIAFRLLKVQGPVRFPAKTYLSVPMTMHKLNISYSMSDDEWYDNGCYHFEGTNVWDYARKFSPDMYQPGTIQCVSFGRTKPLEIGKGGCLLTDDRSIAERANRMRYDGRDIFQFTPWVQQKTFEVGFHYYLRPEECIQGMNIMETSAYTPQLPKFFSYPDCREITIIS